MPNKLEQLESELKHTRGLMESIEEAWLEGRDDENGDKVTPAIWADRISMLLDC